MSEGPTVNTQTQTCSACFYNLETPSYDNQHEYVFASVGKCLPEIMECRVLNSDGDVQPARRRGRVQLRGDIIFSRYYNNESATASSFDRDGWFDTGDLGWFDLNGHLMIEGRSKEMIIVNGLKYSSFELEHAIEDSNVAGIAKSYTAVFSSWKRGGDTEGIVVLFSLDQSESVAHDPSKLQSCVNAIKQATLRCCSALPLEVIPLPTDRMPKSTIGKLSRQKLKESYERGDFDQFTNLACNTNGNANGMSGPPLSSDLQKKIAKVFSRESGRPYEEMNGDTDIMFAGMDSIAYLRLKYSLERELQLDSPLPLTALGQAGTIKNLERAILTTSPSSESYDPIVVLQSQGSKIPLFCLPPGVGDFILYLGLVEYLVDRPIYALYNRGSTSGEGGFSSLQTMLE